MGRTLDYMIRTSPILASSRDLGMLINFGDMQLNCWECVSGQYFLVAQKPFDPGNFSAAFLLISAYEFLVENTVPASRREAGA